MSVVAQFDKLSHYRDVGPIQNGDCNQRVENATLALPS